MRIKTSKTFSIWRLCTQPNLKEKMMSAIEGILGNNPPKISNTEENMIGSLSIEVKTVDNKKRGATELPTLDEEDEVGSVVEEIKPIKIDVLHTKIKKQFSAKMNFGLH